MNRHNSDDTYHGQYAIYFGGHVTTDRSQLKFFDVQGLKECDVILLKKCLKDSALFSVKDNRCKKTDNSFAKLKNNTYIRIINFVINKVTKEEMVLYCEITSKIHGVLSKNNSAVRLIVEEHDSLKMTTVNNLVNICVITEMYGTMYISELANTILCNN